MGVKYLQSYVKSECPFVINTVNIKNEIEVFKNNNNGQKPTIIIDMPSILSLIFTNEKEILLGGRYTIYNNRTEEILKKLIDYDVEIVCVLDGSLFEDKIATIMERKTAQYMKEWEILEKIKNGLDLTNLTKSNLKLDKNLPYLRIFIYNLRLILSKEKHCELIISTRESDQETVFQANKRNALAVISNDTDFLIFHGEWQLWHTCSMNLKYGTIQRFNKETLRSQLDLQSQEMILFATLCGNDFVQYKMIKNFHNKLHDGYWLDKFDTIAEIVKTINCSNLPNLTEDDEETLINLMFEQTDKSKGQKHFKNSINFYSNVNEENLDSFHSSKISISSRLLEKASNSHFLYSILCDVPFLIILLYFDLTETDDSTKVSYYNLVQPMLRRQFGTILKSCGKSETENRRFISKLQHREEYKIIHEIPVFPNYDIPSLEEFILTPANKETDLYKTKVELFCWHILPDCDYFKFDKISNLPDELVLTISTITFLCEENQITLDEADIILFACVANDRIKKKFSLVESVDQLKTISKRDATIAFLFTRLYVEVEHSVQVLGLTNFESLLTFDGCYYHYLIQNLEKENKLLFNLKKHFEHLRIYKR